ncbi:MAG: hypothetical protein IPM85_02280 [Chitinophagaceae bacterium]|nr:hypothetical protein [Chitinophagaceae bacterium]
MKLLAKFLLILFPCWMQGRLLWMVTLMNKNGRIIGVANSNNNFGPGDDLGLLKYHSDATTLYIGITCRLTSYNNVVLFFDDENYAGRGNAPLAGTTGWSNTGVFKSNGNNTVSCGTSGGLDGAIMDYECMDLDYAFSFNEGGQLTTSFLMR